MACEHALGTALGRAKMHTTQRKLSVLPYLFHVDMPSTLDDPIDANKIFRTYITEEAIFM